MTLVITEVLRLSLETTRTKSAQDSTVVNSTVDRFGAEHRGMTMKHSTGSLANLLSAWPIGKRCTGSFESIGSLMAKFAPAKSVHIVLVSGGTESQSCPSSPKYAPIGAEHRCRNHARDLTTKPSPEGPTYPRIR